MPLDRTPLELTRMQAAVFNRLAAASPMGEHLKLAAGRVLVQGWTPTAAAEGAGVPPSVVARSCRALLQAAPVAGGPFRGPLGAFEGWYGARVIVEEGAEASGPDLRADLAAWAPGVVVSRMLFGRWMADRGHEVVLRRGVSMYRGLRLKQ